MLTIAGGIVLGGIILFVLAAIASTEEGCAFLAWAVGLIVVGGGALLAYGIWGDDFISLIGTLFLLGLAWLILQGLATFVRTAWDARKAAKRQRNSDQANTP